MSHPPPDRSPQDGAFVPRSQLRRRVPLESTWAGDRLDLLAGRLSEFAADLPAEERAAFASLLGATNPALTVLGAVPPREILEPVEAALVERLRAAPRPAGRSLPTRISLIMKATLRCNLRCTYCSSWSDRPNSQMTFEVLAHAIHGALQSPGVRSVSFAWHGGETTLRSRSFYRKALWLQEHFRVPGQTVSNSIQTNGTRLTDEWLDFFERYRVSVGISLDGPPEIHDSRRVDVGGRPTSERVRAGLHRLQERRVAHGVLMVVDDLVVRLGAERMLEYLTQLGVRRVSLLNVAPEGDPADASPEEPYLEYGRFVGYLRDVFRVWHAHYADRITIRELADLVSKMRGHPHGFCVYGPNCIGRYFTIEPTGDVSHCDKYQQDPAFRFGNVVSTPLGDIPAAPALLRAHKDTAAGLDRCRGCAWFGVCQGGCPYDRYVRVVRRGGEQDERCCGLAPLLRDIAEAVGPATAITGAPGAAGETVA